MIDIRSNIALPLLLVFSILSCRDQGAANDSVILDVKRIVNKSPEEVEEILGEPDSAYTITVMGKRIFCQAYAGNSIEIQYPDRRARDILVTDQTRLAFDQTALSAFGLDYKKQHPSDYKKGSFIRWSNFDDFSAISLYATEKDSLNRVTAFNIFFKSREASNP